MTPDPYYELFYRESKGGEWRFGDSRYTYADAESGAISLFKSEKTVEVEVFEVVAEQRRRVFSAYRDRRGYIYGQREDEIDREKMLQMPQEQEKRREREEQEKQQQQERQENDIGYGF